MPSVNDGEECDGVGRRIFGDEFVEFTCAVWRADEVKGGEASSSEVVVGVRPCLAECL